MTCLGRRGSSDRPWSLLLGWAVVAVGAEGIFVAEIWSWVGAVVALTLKETLNNVHFSPGTSDLWPPQPPIC